MEIKRIPEDFIVKEISNIKVKDSGRYSYFRLTKTNRNTLDVVKQLAKLLNIGEKQIGFAGSKDKNAVTDQIISVSDVSKNKVLGTKIDNVELEFVGYGDKPVSLGDLEGNHFEIVIRNIDDVINPIEFVENYFDEQRFSKHNVEIGRSLVKKDFKNAVSLIDDRRVKEYIEKNRNDFIGALKKKPIRLLRMYINAYQSYLWNKTVEKILRNSHVVMEVDYSLGTFVFVEEMKDLKVPLIGFGSEEWEDKEVKEIIKGIMDQEEISYRDFIIKQIPELSLEGDLRDVFVNVKDISIGELEVDEFNDGMRKVKVKFSLPKGSYATMVVRRQVNIY